MALLDGDRFEGQFRDSTHTTDVSDLMRRMVKENLLKFDATPLFPERITHTVPYKLSDAEAQLYTAVTNYVRDEFNRAENLQNDRKGTVGFALPLAALDLPARTVKQWPFLGVRTKNRKAATTYLLEIPDLLEAVKAWDDFIRAQLPPEAMWYTPVIVHLDGKTLSVNPSGASRTSAIGKRMRRLFATAGLPARSTHKFRHGHAVWALQHAQTMADYKAISMNLMYDDVRVTDGIYAPLPRSEVRERVSRLAEQSSSGTVSDEKLVEYLRKLSKGQVSQALHIMADQLAR